MGSSVFVIRYFNFKSGQLAGSLLAAALTILSIFPIVGLAAESAPAADLKSVSSQGLADLVLEKGHANLCVLTNAPYVRLDDAPAVRCLDTITDITGCTQGRGNLLFYHASVTGGPRIVLFRKDTGRAILMTARGGSGDRLTSPCSPVEAKSGTAAFQAVTLDIGPQKIVEPEAYKSIMKQVGEPAEAFSIAGILSAWALGAPYDFMKCCEFHNHYCPGVTIGYFIARIVLDKYPLSKGQKYVWIGSPAKCGDDAIQVLLDLTPSKRTCYIKELTPAQKKAITVEEPLNNVMGMLVVWDNARNQGRAAVFKYDWGKACQVSGLKYADFNPDGGAANPLFWTSRLKSNLAMIRYFDRPSEFVSVAREVEVSPEMYVRLISAGTNPYEAIGLVKP